MSAYTDLVDEIAARRPWQPYCVFDPALWTSEKTADLKIAARICESCLVREPCERAGEEDGHYVWGGTVYRRQDGPDTPSGPP